MEINEIIKKLENESPVFVAKYIINIKDIDFKLKLINKFDQKVINMMYDIIKSINNDEIKINLCKKYEIDYFYLNKLYNTIGASNKNKFKNDLGIYVDYDKIRNEIKKDINLLNIKNDITIGFEIEFDKLEYDKFKTLMLIIEKEDNQIYNLIKDWKIEKELSLPEGAEAVSPILRNYINSWKQLKCMLEIVKNAKTSLNEKCGGHIHIGADILSYDSKKWNYFWKMCSISQPILYKIANEEGKIIRKSSVKFAKQNQDMFNNLIKNGGVNIKGEEDLKLLVKQFCTDKNVAINLKNVGTSYKNTIEFRISNQTFNFEEVVNNARLYLKMVDTSVRMVDEKGYKEKEFNKFLNNSMSEKDLLINFLNVIFEDDNEKKIYIKRWEKIKDNDIYKKLEER